MQFSVVLIETCEFGYCICNVSLCFPLLFGGSHLSFGLGCDLCLQSCNGVVGVCNCGLISCLCTLLFLRRIGYQFLCYSSLWWQPP